jgi:hypothetical protein
MSALNVDDAEAAHSESEITVSKKSGIVGAAVDQPVALASDDASLDPASSSPVPACYSTHMAPSP